MERNLIRSASWLGVVPALAFGLWLASAGPVQAGPLNPLDYTSLGAFPTASGTYTFDTDGTPTLRGPGGNVIETGVVSNGIAVFDFNAIDVNANQVFLGGSGALPLALLSQTGATIEGGGIIDVSGSFGSYPAFGGPGGGSGGFEYAGPGYPAQPGSGPGGGGAGATAGLGYGPYPGGGGGGFGGAGGVGGAGAVSGGAGGASYGNLLQELQGGSGGGGAYFGVGGGGGGALELGAVGTINIAGDLYANGGMGTTGGGGGSGGALFIHAQAVNEFGAALISAIGGNGGAGEDAGGPYDPAVAYGGGGGGGRVTIMGTYMYSGDENSLIVSVAGGSPNGGDGVFTSVPEPASLVTMGTGCLALLGIAWMRRTVAA